MQFTMQITPQQMKDLTAKGQPTNQTWQQLLEARVQDYCAAVARDVGSDERAKLIAKLMAKTDAELASIRQKIAVDL